MSDSVRPTKKQKELLGFIEAFIAQHGYSPSYREIMTGLDYTSVATVALHVNSLIKRGHLLKRDGKARSLEVPNSSSQASQPTDIQESEERWLVHHIERLFTVHEQADELEPTAVEQLHTLVNALRILGLEAAAQSFMPRLTEIRERAASVEM